MHLFFIFHKGCLTQTGVYSVQNKWELTCPSSSTCFIAQTGMLSWSGESKLVTELTLIDWVIKWVFFSDKKISVMLSCHTKMIH